MTDFTPFLSFLGGTLIGLAVVSLMLVHGRIAGISGILGGLLSKPNSDEWAWRAAFVAGMIVSPIVLHAATGSLTKITIPVSYPALLVGGFLVGIGVSFGSGCTSGHGVCGLSRFSARSMVATGTFMITAMATVFATRHIFGG
ncbi:hypothetical protein JM93_02590 [Roseibium hamelinense]|uniref:Uncharacterized protein n=1 Tax=Roseibium hamelinense TaxID=150831 RepID=A0A562T2A4_9HYPH|nr:YeeE/YedE family protein [Roseibium hamelinense]MTI44718.1 YeeE/YedE family protein [Roseibium hamelinense]TWI87348.1 hypothetical protein JM93_02590 [Roseibium hamelinense]